jgi:hypothetical protein
MRARARAGKKKGKTGIKKNLYMPERRVKYCARARAC